MLLCFPEDLECVLVEDRENRQGQGSTRSEYGLLKAHQPSDGCQGT